MKVKHRYFIQRGCRESEVTLAEYLYVQFTEVDDGTTQNASAMPQNARPFNVEGLSGRIKTEIEE